MRIAIVEDDKRDMAELKSAIEVSAADCGMDTEIDTFFSGPDFLWCFTPGKYDLVFFDNYIGDGLGIDFARKTRAMDDAVEFVFVSMSPEFAVSGYEVRALHYLLKPATPAAMAQIFERFRKHAPKPETKILEVMSNYRPCLIPIPSIRYIRMDHNNCTVCAKEELPVRMPLEKLMELLPPGEFVRVHKSYAVRLGAIQALGQNEFILKDGETIPIGRAYQNASKIAFIDYLVSHK